jgi:hypothetical protein
MLGMQTPPPTHRYARVLTIAGSDSGGGAGIQADLKTFAALGCFGTSAITALTAQNTLGVQAIHAVPAAFLKAQIQSVLDDIGTDAIKIGMLHTPEVAEVVAWAIEHYSLQQVVFDPVMVATSVAGRGLDVPEIVCVVNYNCPNHLEDYVHRVGRTARAGRSGRAITFVTQYDVELYQRIEALLGKKLPP